MPDYFHNQQHYVLVLEDREMIALLELAGNGDQAGIDRYMMDRPGS